MNDLEIRLRSRSEVLRAMAGRDIPAGGATPCTVVDRKLMYSGPRKCGESRRIKNADGEKKVFFRCSHSSLFSEQVRGRRTSKEGTNERSSMASTPEYRIEKAANLSAPVLSAFPPQ